MKHHPTHQCRMPSTPANQESQTVAYCVPCLLLVLIHHLGLLSDLHSSDGIFELLCEVHLGSHDLSDGTVGWEPRQQRTSMVDQNMVRKNEVYKLDYDFDKTSVSGYKLTLWLLLKYSWWRLSRARANQVHLPTFIISNCMAST